MPGDRAPTRAQRRETRYWRICPKCERATIKAGLAWANYLKGRLLILVRCKECANA